MTLTQLAVEAKWPNPNWARWLEWLKTKSRLVNEPAMRRISRDPKDNPILAVAISERVGYLVSYDRDILDLERPYGVFCVKPQAFIASVLSNS